MHGAEVMRLHHLLRSRHIVRSNPRYATRRFQPLGGGRGVREKGFYRVEWAKGSPEYLVEEEVVPLLCPDPNPVIPDPVLPVPWPQPGPPSLLRRRLEDVVAEGASELRFGLCARVSARVVHSSCQLFACS